MKMKYVGFLLGIIIVATILRFFQLGSTPPSLNWDEAAWGYNGYSIGIDGKDEFGRFLPHDYLESFGDFKPPVYAYAAILPVKVFGLNAVATRFPSALAGTLTVLITYFLVKRLFPKSKYKEWYALASAGVLAISPWHIMLSRAAFEANVATFFVVTGVWLFLAGMQEKKWYLVLSAIPFALSFYTFNTPRVVTPLLVITLSIVFWKELLKKKKQIILAALLGIVLLLPTVQFLLSPQASLRFQEVNIFSDVAVVKHSNQEITNDGNSVASKVLHNRRLVFSADFLKHYFDNLSPSFLFISGDDNKKFSTQDVGEMYLWDIPFLIIGIVFLFRNKEGNWWVIPLWLLLGIIPAATARETPHALRTEITLPTFQMLVGYGLVTVIIFLQQHIKRTIAYFAIVCCVFSLLFWSVVYFQHGYYTYYPHEYSGDWNYAYTTSIAYVLSVQSHYDKVVVTTDLGRPYIYYLLYMHIQPGYFRKTANIERDVFGFVHVNSFGKYVFTDRPSSITGGKILYIGNAERTPKTVHIVKVFKKLDGGNSLVAYTL